MFQESSDNVDTAWFSNVRPATVVALSGVLGSAVDPGRPVVGAAGEGRLISDKVLLG